MDSVNAMLNKEQNNYNIGTRRSGIRSSTFQMIDLCMQYAATETSTARTTLNWKDTRIKLSMTLNIESFFRERDGKGFFPFHPHWIQNLGTHHSVDNITFQFEVHKNRQVMTMSNPFLTKWKKQIPTCKFRFFTNFILPRFIYHKRFDVTFFRFVPRGFYCIWLCTWTSRLGISFVTQPSSMRYVHRAYTKK